MAPRPVTRSSCLVLVVCLLVAQHFQDSQQLIIKRVDIPVTVKAGEEFVVLDCDYDLEDTSTKGLVVKWYFNELDLVYQWIFDTLPQAVAPALKYIDLRYKASNDKTKMYRAMKLLGPDIDLTGNYTCQISTFEDEVSEKRAMTVYSSGRQEEFKLWHTKMSYDGDDGVEVTCQALGLYPKPTLDITVEGYPEMRSPRPLITETEDGHYNIVSYLTLEDDDLSDSVVINCVLGIPAVNYNATKKIVHYPPGRATTTATAITVGGTTKLLRKMEIQALDNSQADASSGGGNGAGHVEISLSILFIGFAAYLLLGH